MLSTSGDTSDLLWDAHWAKNGKIVQFQSCERVVARLASKAKINVFFIFVFFAPQAI